MPEQDEKKCPKCKYGYLAPIGTKEKEELNTGIKKEVVVLGCDECQNMEVID